ncbi:MAG: iron-containing alcohol dehydrogenase [Clostridia bacterium]|nr:iron-containing alcohol dehydrogenase [Clostridia bacterium]
MNIFKKAYCRVFQGVFRLIMPILPYRKPQILNNALQIKEQLNNKNITSVLIVTDHFLYSNGYLNDIINTLNSANIQTTVFSEVKPNPTVENVEGGVIAYKNANAQAIIAFGGGSPMDAAKGIGARIAYPKKSLKKLKGLLKVLRKTPPIFAIPTTAGTGSEVTLTAVITDSKTKYKYTMNSFPLIPSYAVLDAKNTVTLPKNLTSTTGLDALTHAVEAYIGRSTTKQTRKCAEDAVKLIYDNLFLAYEHPENLTARENMLNAAYLAGIAFSRSYVGYVHAVAHSLGGQYNLPHGLANSVLLPVVLEQYGKSVYKKLFKLALICGLVGENDSQEVGAKAFISWIKKLNEKMNIPTAFDCVKKEDIQLMAKHADSEANPLYPVPVLMDAKQLEIFYYKVLQEE